MPYGDKELLNTRLPRCLLKNIYPAIRALREAPFRAVPATSEPSLS